MTLQEYDSFIKEINEIFKEDTMTTMARITTELGRVPKNEELPIVFCVNEEKLAEQSYADLVRLYEGCYFSIVVVEENTRLGKDLFYGQSEDVILFYRKVQNVLRDTIQAHPNHEREQARIEAEKTRMEMQEFIELRAERAKEQSSQIKAIISLTLGTSSVLLFLIPLMGLILGIVGIVLAAKARPYAYGSYNKMRIAGKVTSIIGTALGGLSSCAACFGL